MDPQHNELERSCQNDGTDNYQTIVVRTNEPLKKQQDFEPNTKISMILNEGTLSIKSC